MSFQGDPHRILGVPPGAGLDEVKRAYRRLAKQYHPDSAGAAAVKRFLAVQSAYEALLRSRGAPIGGRAARPGNRTDERAPDRTDVRRDTEGPRGPGQAWSADPERARSTRERYAGTSRARWARPERESSPGRAEDAAGAARDRDGAPGQSRGSPDWRRRARPGSTTYDGADAEGGASTWEGATWYGAASGEYWRINPREYADPRKHGPEYQARGRDSGATHRWASAGSETPSGGTDGRSGTDGRFGTDSGARNSDGAGWTDGGGTGSAGARPGSWATHRGGATDRGRATDRGGATDRSGAADGAPDMGPTPPRSRSAAAGSSQGPLRRLPDRLLLALLAWPPLGFGAAGVIGEVTGCGRFAASCPAPAQSFGWIVPLLVLGLLVIAPAAARPGAVATIVVLLAGIPAAAVLAITGGAKGPPGAAQAVLLGLLALAYGAGIAIGLLGANRLPEPLGRRVR
ncbi:MAG TPA: DnaJ domain-containing protein [Candidatus Limnocylindrales bacterium]